MLTQAQVRTVSAGRPEANPVPRTLPIRGNFGVIELMGSQMTFGPNEEIFGENEPAEYVYKVMKGAVRTYRILSDGRRQIGGFYLPGDIFGLEVGSEHQFSAEAINHATVTVIRRSAVLSLAERDCEAAPQRVACFLLEMSERLATTDAIELPMSRQDIADYLGLTIETVSRTMTQLASNHAIGLPSARQIVLRNRNALRQLNS
jgi:CRP/FNR family transcriptional regulator, nitrogen fixation regulation protein